MAAMDKLDDIRDQTKNPDLEQYRTAEKELETFRQRLTKIESNKKKFSEKVYTKVYNEYKTQLVQAEEKVDPLRDKLTEDLQGFANRQKELSILHNSLTETLEELELRHIAGEVTAAEFHSKKAQSGKNAAAIKEKLDILTKNISAYSAALNMEAIPEPEPVREVEVADQEEEYFEGAKELEEVDEPVDTFADEAESVIEGASDDLDSWHELPEETPESIDEPTDFEEMVAGEDKLGQTLEDNYDVDLKDDIQADLLEEPEESTPPEVIPENIIPFLVVVEGNTEEPEYSLEREVITIGRGPDNDIQLANDTSVSRHHTRITLEGSEYIITDLDSSNGTYVNGERITQIALSENDEISIGQTLLLFKYHR